MFDVLGVFSGTRAMQRYSTIKKFKFRISLPLFLCTYYILDIIARQQLFTEVEFSPL